MAVVRGMRERLAERDGCRCRYCGRDLSLVQLTIEHLVPSARGGSNAAENLGLACLPCNHLKGPLTETEFLPLRHDPERLKVVTKAMLNGLNPQEDRRRVPSTKTKPPRVSRPVLSKAPKQSSPDTFRDMGWCGRCRKGDHGRCISMCWCPQHDCWTGAGFGRAAAR